MNNKLRFLTASSLSSIATIFFVTIMTIVAELVPSFKNWLTQLSGHHWTSKSILSVILFVVLLLFFIKVMRTVSGRLARAALIFASVSAMTGFVILLLFFSGHYLEWY